MNENFKEGFEKNANVFRQGAKALGRLTGVSQLKTGLKQIKRARKSGLATPHISGKGFTSNNPSRFKKEFGPNGSVEKRLQSGAKRLAVTGAVGVGAAGYGAHKLTQNK